jgi:putative effector of murein hydrolase
MSEVVHLWTYLASSPLFGLTATVTTYVLVHALYERLGQAPWANPVMLAVIVLGVFLVATGTPYATYFAGAQFVHVLLGPAVVALGWPLWQRRSELRRRALPLVAGSLVGGSVAAGVAVGGGWALGLPMPILMSLAPKSVTAPVAMGIAERLSGVPALAAAFTLLTGIVGASSGKYLLDAMGVRDWAVRGFAMGTASHGIGAARALGVHPEAGVYAAVGLGLQVLFASFLIPLAATLLRAG